MTRKQIIQLDIALNIIVGLNPEWEEQDVLEELKGTVFSDEEVGEYREYLMNP